jgi:hypothetical protein
MPHSWAEPDPIRSPTTTSPVAMPTRVCREMGDASALTEAIISSPAGGKGRIDLAGRAGVEDMELQSEDAGGFLRTA